MNSVSGNSINRGIRGAPVDLRRLTAAYVALALVTAPMEAIWYLGVAFDLYDKEIGSLMNAQFDVPVAVIYYLVYSLGALIFAVRPALEANVPHVALQRGALLGFFCYSTHDLTNLADVHGYTWTIALVDIAWGAFVTGAACWIGYFAGDRIFTRHRADDRNSVGDRG